MWALPSGILPSVGKEWSSQINKLINKSFQIVMKQRECDDSSVQIKLEMIIGESLLAKVLWESFVEEME